MKRKRRLFQKEVAELAVERFKFLDESSVNLSLTRLHGRAAPGQRIVDSTPQPSGPQTTTLAVVGWTGITAPLVLSGAVNGTVFYGYIQQCVVPTLKSGDILFMDNLSAHKVAGLDELIRSCGAHLIYLPPYSPDFNPIEPCWGKVKQKLRSLQARTVDAIEQAISEAIATITPDNASAWFAPCGYDLQE